VTAQVLDGKLVAALVKDEAHFDKFDRVRAPRVTYAGMLQYDGDLQLPKRFLVAPPAIKDTSAEWFSKSGLAQFACSETQKFGHVTYFWNGNRSGKFDGETYLEVPSDVVPFEQRPWMKAAEIADAMIAAIQSGQYKTLRCNFANGDMVGHTGVFDAAVKACEAVDHCIGRVTDALAEVGGECLITADHGNAEKMLDEETGQAHTAHTNLPVPLIYFGRKAEVVEGGKLSDLAPTMLTLMGLPVPPEMTGKPLMILK